MCIVTRIHELHDDHESMCAKCRVHSGILGPYAISSGIGRGVEEHRDGDSGRHAFWTVVNPSVAITMLPARES
jgi:hypothetical protein